MLVQSSFFCRIVYCGVCTAYSCVFVIPGFALVFACFICGFNKKIQERQIELANEHKTIIFLERILTVIVRHIFKNVFLLLLERIFICNYGMVHLSFILICFFIFFSGISETHWNQICTSPLLLLHNFQQNFLVDCQKYSFFLCCPVSSDLLCIFVILKYFFFFCSLTGNCNM